MVSLNSNLVDTSCCFEPLQTRVLRHFKQTLRLC